MTNQFYKIFQGAEDFYLADPTKLTIKKNGGHRWGVEREFYQKLPEAINGHLTGQQKLGVVLPPIRKSDYKCTWGAIDIDGNIYTDDKFKKELLDKIQELKLPLTACFSKSKGLHLFIKFVVWTEAEKVIQILKNFLKKLNLPEDTEIFPKQSTLTEKGIGNGIMLPFMKDVGNDWIKDWKDEFITGTVEEFEYEFLSKGISWGEVKLEPEETKPKEVKEDFESKYTKLEILKKIKDGSIEQHPTIGGTYYSWIQVVICKAIKQGYGDNEILALIKEVHRNDIQSEYKWPESYIKQINYTRGQRQLNIPNPGETQILEGRSFESASKLEEIKKSYCYVKANDMFYQFGTTEFYLAAQINNYHKHEVFLEKGTLTNKLLGSRDFKRAETFITSARFKPGIIKIDKPGMIPMINRGIVLNIYIPNYLQPKKGDVKFVIDFFNWLIGEDKWKIIEQWIAFMLQQPGIKMKWAIVLVSNIEGVGKGLLARICSRILGYENVNENANYKHLTNTHNTLLVGTQLLVLNEVTLGDFKSKAEGTNTLKNFVADDVYSCNFKNKPMIKLPNLTNFMLFSNDERVLSINDGARRYYFCNIAKTEEDIINKSDSGEFQRLWDFADSDEGAAALINYFKNEVKIEDPTIFFKRAPITDDLKQLIEQSKHPVIKKLEYDLSRPDLIHRKIFQHDWTGLATFNWLNDQMSTTKDTMTRDRFDWGSYGDDALYKFLSANGKPWNNGESTRQIEIDGVRQRFYLLDDSRCPIPGKSYRDLTPKQIEVIYKNYNKINQEIESEEPNYKEAKEGIDGAITNFKIKIKSWIDEANTKKTNYNKRFRGKTVDEIWADIQEEKIKVIEKSPEEELTRIRNYQKLISRGIRTPEQILEIYKERYSEAEKEPPFRL